MSTEYNEIQNDYKNRITSLEGVFERLSLIGFCPALLNDDDGRWALVFDGMQTVPEPDNDEPIDVQTSFFVEAHMWKPTIYEAILYTLSLD